MDRYREVMAGFMAGQRSRRTAPHLRRGVLVGQAAPAPKPNTRHEPLFPYPPNCAGERLHRFSGWSLEDWFTLWDRVNTLPHFPGRSGKGDDFPLKLARHHAELLAAELVLDRAPCVFVGKANASCYDWGVPLPPPLELVWRGPDLVPWAWVPHTSGIVAFWNDPANRERAADLFRVLRNYFVLQAK